MSDEKQHSQDIITLKERRLRVLERKQAFHGASCPVEIILEIEDLSQELENLRAKAKSTIQFDQRTILVVDDRLSNNDPLINLIRDTFVGNAEIHLVADPDKACSLLTSEAMIAGCIVDVVFRNQTDMAVERIVECATKHNIPSVVFTSHKKRDIGVWVAELQSSGLSDERILNKPLSIRDHYAFQEKLKRLLNG